MFLIKGDLSWHTANVPKPPESSVSDDICDDEIHVVISPLLDDVIIVLKYSNSWQ